MPLDLSPGFTRNGFICGTRSFWKVEIKKNIPQSPQVCCGITEESEAGKNKLPQGWRWSRGHKEAVALAVTIKKPCRYSQGVHHGQEVTDP